MRYRTSDIEGEIGLGRLDQPQETITSRVFDAIYEAITTAVIRPGQRVSEKLIAEELGVSKTPVRESLLKLYHLGILDRINGRLHVIERSSDRIANAYHLRALLESEAAYLAATNASQAARDQMMATARASLELHREDKPREREIQDRGFHDSVLRASGNTELARVANDLFYLAWMIRVRDLPATREEQAAGDHFEIAKAIQSGDGEAARNLMRSHLMELGRKIT